MSRDKQCPGCGYFVIETSARGLYVCTHCGEVVDDRSTPFHLHVLRVTGWLIAISILAAVLFMVIIALFGAFWLIDHYLWGIA